MKIITLLSFFLFLGISNSTNSASENKEKWVWEPFISNDTGTYYYHKQEKPKTREEFFLAGIIIIYRQPQPLVEINKPQVSYQSKYQTVMFDCNKNTVSTPDIIYYSSNTGSGEPLGFETIEPPKVKWIAIKSNIIYSTLLNHFEGACE
jgi:hypothetical protein